VSNAADRSKGTIALLFICWHVVSALRKHCHNMRYINWLFWIYLIFLVTTVDSDWVGSGPAIVCKDVQHGICCEASTLQPARLMKQQSDMSISTNRAASAAAAACRIHHWQQSRRNTSIAVIQLRALNTAERVCPVTGECVVYWTIDISRHFGGGWMEAVFSPGILRGTHPQKNISPKYRRCNLEMFTIQ